MNHHKAVSTSALVLQLKQGADIYPARIRIFHVQPAKPKSLALVPGMMGNPVFRTDAQSACLIYSSN